MTYQGLEIPSLADELEGLSLESYQSTNPGWTAPDGSPEGVLFASTSLQIAELALKLDLTAEELTVIAAGLRNIHRNAAVSATVQATYAFNDGVPHTIEAGSVVVIYDASGFETAWAVQTEVTATTATTAGQVTLVAVEAGADGNDITGTCLPVQPSYTWVDTITIVGLSAGGVDEESYPEFLSKASRLLTVGSNLIVKADQLAAVVSSLPGVGRALAIRAYNPTGPDPAAPGHMTVAVADLLGADYAAIHASIEALPTADCNQIHAVSFNRHPVRVTATVVKHDDWESAVVKAACETALAAFLSPLAWAARPEGEEQSMYVEPTVLMDQIAHVLNSQPSVKRVTFSTVNIGVDGGAITHTDKTLTGDFPITYVATPATDLVVTVT